MVWRNNPDLNDEWLYKQFMLYSHHGQSKDAYTKTQKGAWEYDIICPGYKCNMTDLLAGIGLAQLPVETFWINVKLIRNVTGCCDDRVSQHGALW